MKKYEEMGLDAKGVMEFVTSEAFCLTCPCSNGNGRCSEKYNNLIDCMNIRFAYLNSEVYLKPRLFTPKTVEDLDKSFDEWRRYCREDVESIGYLKHAVVRCNCFKDWLKEEVEYGD